MNKKINHVAIIMDGNRRWARDKNISFEEAYLKGIATLKSVVEEAICLEIKVLTVFAFSTENWRRSHTEIEILMNLLDKFLKSYLSELIENKIALKYIGNIEDLRDETKENFLDIIQKTEKGDQLDLVFALNYGGRDEMVRACRKISMDVKKDRIQSHNINESLLESYLDTHAWPCPELLIRTSGDTRVSNFLLWQISYTEILFTSKLWPDYTRIDFKENIESYFLKSNNLKGGR